MHTFEDLDAPEAILSINLMSPVQYQTLWTVVATTDDATIISSLTFSTPDVELLMPFVSFVRQSSHSAWSLAG